MSFDRPQPPFGLGGFDDDFDMPFPLPPPTDRGRRKPTKPNRGRWSGVTILGAGATLLSAAGVAAGILPTGAPLAGIGLAATGATASHMTKTRRTKTDTLHGLRTKLDRMMGRGGTLTVKSRDRRGPTRVRIRYSPMFDDHNAAKRAAVAEQISSSLPGRWDTTWDTENNLLTAWRRPDLPDRIDRPVEPDPDRFPLGITGDGKRADWVPSVMPHALISGTTGAGKSVSISGIILHALASGWEVRICDGKGTTLAGFQEWPGVTLAGFGDAEEMAPVLTATERDMHERYRRVRRGEVETEDLHPILLVLDEAAAMSATLKAWWRDNKPSKGGGATPPGIDAWRMVLREGREARVHLVIGIQQAAAHFFEGTEARDNIACRVALGPTSKESAEMMFGAAWVGRDIPIAKKGRGTLTTGDSDRFVEFQAYYAPELRPSGKPRNGGDEFTVKRWWALARDAQPATKPAEMEPAAVESAVVEVCAQPGCDKPAARGRRGMCSACYQRSRRARGDQS